MQRGHPIANTGRQSPCSLNPNTTIMAITNFFSQVAALDFQGSLLLTLKKDGEQLTVSLLLRNEASGGDTKHNIPPLLLKGTPAELGEGFFPSITEPVQSTSQLLVNLEQFRKGQEETKKQAAKENKKTEKDTEPKAQASPKEQQYAKALAQADALENEGKFKEAWCKLPQPAEFPDNAEEIRKRRASLSAKFSPDLFGAGQPTTTEVEPKTEEDATDNENAEGFPDEREGQ